MRRVNPATLARIRIAPPRLRISSSPRSSGRLLSTSRPTLFPRVRPNHAEDAKTREDAASRGIERDPEEHFVEDDNAESIHEAGTPFHSLVTSVHAPSSADEALPEDLKTLHHHLLVSFLPKNQPRQPSVSLSKSVRPDVLQQGQWHSINLSDLEELDHQSQPTQASTEAVLALVTPFEGGQHYVTDAVLRVASQMDADVLRFDLALGLGIDGPGSPLGRAGHPAPTLPKTSNPLIQDPTRPAVQSPPPSNPFANPEEDMEDAEDDTEAGRHGAIVVTPMTTRLPFGASAGTQPENPVVVVREEWVTFFEHWINREDTASEDTGVLNNRKRIILLESVESMACSFDEWWPSLLEAVRRRRRADSTSAKGKSPSFTLTQPTTVILSSSPSLLLQYTSPPTPPKEDAEAAVQSLHPMLQEIADRLGGTIETKIDHHDSGPIWWGSVETDEMGRTDRDAKRLAALLGENKGPLSLLPSLGSASKIKGPSKSRHPILDMLTGHFSRPQIDDRNQSDSLIWKALSIVPSERKPAVELVERIRKRSLLSAALLSNAIHEYGGHLTDPATAASLVKVEPSAKKKRDSIPRFLRIGSPAELHVDKLAQGKPYRIAKDSWQNSVQPWSLLRKLAGAAIGRKLAADPDSSEPVPVTWKNILEATHSERQQQERHIDVIKRLLPPKPAVKLSPKQGTPAVPKVKVDPVIESVKKSKDLTTYEKRLLGSIVDTNKLSSTTFDEVHLPYKTIDGIRTVISLPLLFPEAFRGGVLKDHATTGALLFGPPGTGKTLLARAVANESGARMLAIQPSDVNDKYIGEGEKLVKAVFSLARRLSPCVIFLDEVDALFGARSARGGGIGHKAHDQLLTEFMQEMDGLSSAAINKDKRIVVVGATNRPFDLDDAVLRRLPRRLLVDLPGEADRKAILAILLKGEVLGGDVDVVALAKDTDGFSGSDLKHLCVSAALASVKDSVQVPWGIHTSSSRQSTTSVSKTHTAASSSADAHVEETMPLASARETETQPVASTIQAGLQLSAGSSTRAEAVNIIEPSAFVDLMEPSHEEKGSVTSTTANSVKDHGSAAQMLAPSTSPVDTLPRTLLKKHFDVALSEIRPSSSEEGSLPELRKWADQFGEGGTQRGRKKGFGKGFGFGDPALQSNRDQGYGKVASED